jgi:hypothetical protein
VTQPATEKLNPFRYSVFGGRTIGVESGTKSTEASDSNSSTSSVPADGASSPVADFCEGQMRTTKKSEIEV